jgi:cob(I)alamin adenosyltransferase
MSYFLELAQQYPHDAAAQLADQSNEIERLRTELAACNAELSKAKEFFAPSDCTHSRFVRMAQVDSGACPFCMQKEINRLRLSA